MTGTFALMTRIALVVVYLVGMVATIISLEDTGSGGTAWMAVSVVLGAGTGDIRFAPLSLLGILIAIPFGVPAGGEGDPVLPIWPVAAFIALVSSGLIVLAALMRQTVDARLRRRRALRDARKRLASS